ncbi:nuclear transport factor 2 family protein [Kibdelosporangium phytohabitans]|uniref:DUF4440 domain-containing protein n=1 Tax=Kibdelosporangium phytohabitans TaxID=860235 RepID=A0A0N9I455_9PSEU|nr:nuclear transport factor 2 family protein [Kibdelosporangium phytohabitans]ALG10434.1 hypothetical protein AOZ06_29235 [Kibdelosporangium phytohabitans]MBE1461505.1 hypothetical protein [Kibdelosporangium phytohabitans]
MSTDLVARLRELEQRRIEALLAADTAELDTLHDDAYQLCNPTGTVWGKAEYVQRLATGQVVYDRLAATSDIDALVSNTLAVLRYRCLIEVRVDGAEIPAHECQHIDVYAIGADGRWRCRFSQATGIMDGVAPV